MSRRPNLLFIYTDEQRFDTLSCYGNRSIVMPNLNRFAEQAVVFEKAYVTQPVSTPSRSSLLTGQYPHTNGCVKNNIPLKSETLCLPEMLPTGGWSCAHHGKWHLGDEIYPQHGFTEWLGTEDTYHAFYSAGHDEFADRSAYHHWLVAQGVMPEPVSGFAEGSYEARVTENRFFRNQIHRLPEQYSRPKFLGEQASHYIQAHQDEPFVLFVNFLEPHMPFHSCRDDQYSPDAVELPANCMAQVEGREPLRWQLKAMAYQDQGYGDQPELKTEQQWRELIARYWGMCSLVDTHVGVILETLDRCGLAEDTIVVFTSDHGDMMSSHGLLAKCVMYEEAVRVPMLVRMPGQSVQQRVTGPVSQVDLLPTLLDFMDVQPPEQVQGRSLLPIIEGGGRSDRDVVIEWTADGDNPGAGSSAVGDVQACMASYAADLRTIVTCEGWKLTWSTAGEHQLFDLNTDPVEQVNLIDAPAQSDRIGDLCRRIRSWQQRTGDVLELPEIV